MTACASRVISGTSSKSASNETKTMCSSMTTNKSSQLEALAAVSHANRTLTQARKAGKDAPATRRPLPKRLTAASVRESERRCFLCRVPHLARDGPDRNYNPFDASSPSEQLFSEKAFVRLEPVATSSCRNPFVSLAWKHFEDPAKEFINLPNWTLTNVKQ